MEIFNNFSSWIKKGNAKTTFGFDIDNNILDMVIHDAMYSHLVNKMADVIVSELYKQSGKKIISQIRKKDIVDLAVVKMATQIAKELNNK